MIESNNTLDLMAASGFEFGETCAECLADLAMCQQEPLGTVTFLEAALAGFKARGEQLKHLPHGMAGGVVPLGRRSREH
jgi:hypothetical protein